MAMKGHRKGAEEAAANGHPASRWSACADDLFQRVPANCTDAVQTLMDAMGNQNNEMDRLRRENAELMSQRQQLQARNGELVSATQKLTAELKRLGTTDLSAGVAPSHSRHDDSTSFELLRTLTSHTDPVHGVAVKDNTIATASWDGTVSLHDLANSSAVRCLGADKSMKGLYGCAFAKSQRDIIGCAAQGGLVHLWNYTTAERLTPNHTLKGHAEDVNDMDFHEKQHVLCTASDDRKAIIWDFNEGAALRTLDKHPSAVYGTTFLGQSGGNQYLVGTCCLADAESASPIPSSLHLFDMRDRKEIRQFTDHDDDIIGINYTSSKNLLATGSDDGCIHIYDVRKWEKLYTHSEREAGREVKRISFSLGEENVMMAAGCSDGSICIYSLESKTMLTELRNVHTDCVFDVAWGKDSRDNHILVSASHDKTAKIWQMRR